jgi:hypothetical protein
MPEESFRLLLSESIPIRQKTSYSFARDGQLTASKSDSYVWQIQSLNGVQLLCLIRMAVSLRCANVAVVSHFADGCERDAGFE